MENLGIIGGGAMGAAIIRGIIRGGLIRPDAVFLVEPDIFRKNQLQAELGIQTRDSISELARECRILLLAVKPQVIAEVLKGLQDAVDSRHLVLSIAAGISLAYLESCLPDSRIIRVMPNTPARFAKGISAYAPGKKATEMDNAVSEQILGAVGKVLKVGEAQMDAVTATSGSGPAYLFYFTEAMIDAAVMLGLTRKQAEVLVMETLAGAVEMLRQSNEHPAVLRNEVTSPAGTTAAALLEFEKGALAGTVMQALLAASRRSKELGLELENQR